MYIYIHMTSLSHDDVFASSLVYHTKSVHRHLCVVYTRPVVCDTAYIRVQPLVAPAVQAKA